MKSNASSLVPRPNDKIEFLEDKANLAVALALRCQLHTILISPPKAGKRTQAPRIKDSYFICHVATGDLLCEQVAPMASLGVEAKRAMDARSLVSDDLVFGVIDH